MPASTPPESFAFRVGRLLAQDGVVRPEARYELRDGVELELGLDLFYGPRRGVFGEFRDRSRVSARLRLSL